MKKRCWLSPHVVEFNVGIVCVFYECLSFCHFDCLSLRNWQEAELLTLISARLLWALRLNSLVKGICLSKCR